MLTSCFNLFCLNTRNYTKRLFDFLAKNILGFYPEMAKF